MKQIIVLLPISLFFIIFSCNNNTNNQIKESGTIEATEVIISSQATGIVQKILKDEGSHISKGDTILIIDKESLELQLRQAVAAQEIAKAQYELLIKGARKEDITQAEEGLRQAEVNFNLAKSDYIRMENLFKDQVITQKQYDDALAKYQVTQAQYNAAKENLSKISNFARPEELIQARANYDRSVASVSLIEKNLRDCTVISPISGYIVKKFIEAGEMVSVMSALIKIADLTVVNLSVYISETDLGKVKLGQKVEVTVDAFKNKIFQGNIFFISPEAEFTPKNIQTKDERTRLVFEVKVRIPNPEFELKSGMPADAKIILSTGTKADSQYE
jgi:HlyD family secretion protein